MAGRVAGARRLKLPERLLPLVLASASPRRAALLVEAGVDAVVRPADVDERAAPGETPDATCLRLARAKAAAVARTLETGTVLGGDTLVALDDTALAKPADEVEAKTMLQALAGRRHRVLSAVALEHVASGLVVCDIAVAEVEFDPLSAGWLPGYLATGEWADKAGAYGIQESAAAFARVVDGEWSTVVGLPLDLLAQLASRLENDLA
ncbi:MAG: Maf family protein [Planctomycetota bacterium]|jgi:septum formation protein